MFDIKFDIVALLEKNRIFKIDLVVYFLEMDSYGIIVTSGELMSGENPH